LVLGGIGFFFLGAFTAPSFGVAERQANPPQNKCAMNDKYVSSPFVPAELNGQPKWMVYYHNGS